MTFVVGFYERTWHALSRSGLAIRYVMSRHRWVGITAIILMYQVYAINFGNTALASAATGDTTFLPPGWSATDGAGLAVGNYAVLPLDRGGWTAVDKSILGAITDPLWMMHLFVMSWGLWLFDFILTFDWVDLIALPFEGIATLIEQFLGRFDWIPIALMITGIIAGFLILGGRLGTGLAEVGIALAVTVLAIMLFTNPVKSIYGDGGLLDKAQSVGTQLTAMVTYDNIDQIDVDATNLSGVVTAPLVDLLIRDPAQSISFGKILDGECVDVFNAAMLDKPPIVDQDHVRDEVNKCDESAKEYNENPNFGQVVSVGVILTSSTAVFAIPAVLALLFFMTVFGTLLAGVKAPILAHLAILPYMRRGFFRVAMDIITGIASIVLLCLALAVSLRIIVEMTRYIDRMFELIFTNAIGYGQFPVARAIFINLLIIVTLVFLIRLRSQAKKAGRTMADQLSQIGASRKREHHLRCVSQQQPAWHPLSERADPQSCARAQRPRLDSRAEALPGQRSPQDRTSPRALSRGSPTRVRNRRPTPPRQITPPTRHLSRVPPSLWRRLPRARCRALRW